MKHVKTFENFLNEAVTLAVGDIKIPKKQFIQWMTEYLEETRGYKGAGPSNNYMRAGIKNPPVTVDDFLAWWKEFEKVSGGGFGFGTVGKPDMALAEMFANANRPSQFDSKVGPYIDSTWPNLA